MVPVKPLADLVVGLQSLDVPRELSDGHCGTPGGTATLSGASAKAARVVVTIRSASAVETHFQPVSHQSGLRQRLGRR